MDEALVMEIGITDSDDLDIFDYTQQCIDLYEQALKDMGIITPEVTAVLSTSEILLNL